MSITKPPRPGYEPSGRLIAHPVAVAAIVALVVNDHVLKVLFPGALSWKLSDFAGLVFFPLLLAEVISVAAPTPVVARRYAVVSTAILVTGLAFAMVKLTEAGALTFAWSLGAAQWFVTLGFASGGPVQPAVVVVDPSDLVALPALAVAWAIGTDRVPRLGRPPSSAVRFVIIIAAALSCLATSQAVPESTAEVRVPLNLDAKHPVAVRHISWDVSDVSASDANVALQLTAREAGARVEPEFSFDVVTFTVIPDEGTTLPIDDGFEPVPSNDLTDSCQSGCSGGVTVIVRLDLEKESAAAVDLIGGIVVLGTDNARIDIREDPDRRVDLAPTTVVARLERTVKVTLADPDQRTEVLLTVDGTVLDAPLGFPLVGRAVARVTVTDGAMVSEAHEAALELPNDHVWFTADRPMPDRDWLTHCKPRRECRVPVTLHSRYDPTLDGTLASPDSGSAGFVELAWVLEVRLEAFDGRALPADVIRLEAFGATE